MACAHSETEPVRLREKCCPMQDASSPSTPLGHAFCSAKTKFGIAEVCPSILCRVKEEDAGGISTHSGGFEMLLGAISS